MEEKTTRVRMNVTTTTKGVYTFDVTSEDEDVAKAKANLSEAIKSVKAVMEEQGYKEAGKEIN